MHINNGLGIYWWSPKAAQIGLDPRLGVTLTNLTEKEMGFVDALTISHTDLDIKALANSKNISEDRVKEILFQLDEAGLLDHDRPYLADGDAWWRLRHRLPDHRQIAHIAIPKLDALGFAIALDLVAGGIGSISSEDVQLIGDYDYRRARSDFFGLPRIQALTTLAREVNPHVQLKPTSSPDLVVMTSSHCIDPIAVGNHLSKGIPVLQAWIEEVDVHIGPLSVPHRSPCGTCVYLERLDDDARWVYFAPQAYSGRPVLPELTSFQLGAGFAVREALNFIDGFESVLFQSSVIIPPAPELPCFIEATVHPRCGCKDVIESR
ncbi:hypothetical protein [Arcanobacterium ihumii]|uniref:hypothetical protein n=1 Tax=Arcanobacterium ihumii TaxID=2138162 RepID=UPI000F53BF02|nr:hypothetical protein [Arcanobacterium ihumii]